MGRAEQNESIVRHGTTPHTVATTGLLLLRLLLLRLLLLVIGILKIGTGIGHVQKVAQKHNDAFSRPEIAHVGLNQRGLLIIVEIRREYGDHVLQG
jgi:hypothetical protein